MGKPKNAMDDCIALGHGPLPPGSTPPPSPESLRHTPFSTLRLWQGLRALLKGGQRLRVLAEDTSLPQFYGQWLHRALPEGDFLYQPCPQGGLEDALLRAIDEDRPKAVITLGPFAPARAGALTPPGIPTWIDLPGCLMAEAQLRGDAHHAVYRGILMGALARGDAFSVCSRPQGHALLGQLGLVGRLSGAAQGWEGVHVIPPGIDPTWLGAQGVIDSEGSDAGHPLLVLPRDQKLIVHIGSLNTWSDIDALGEAVDRVLSREPSTHFASLGGPVEGHDPAPAEALWERLAGSDIRDRCWNVGWVSQALLLRILDRASVGITLDKPSVEATLGARTRLGIGLARGLVWVLTPLGEGSRALVEKGLAFGVAPGDGAAAGGVILEALGSAPIDEGAREDHLRVLSPELTMRPLVEWTRHAKVGPAPLVGGGAQEVEGRLAAEVELRRLRGSPTLRALNWIHRRLPRIKTGI